MLSTLGIYGLISFIAVSRTREVGVRIALGATRGSIARLIVSDGIRLMLLGACVGVAILAMAGRLLASLLFGVRVFDAAAIGFAIFILAITTALAALVPAWRSTRVEPIVVLRAE